jgi:hypothetical protein
VFYEFLYLLIETPNAKPACFCFAIERVVDTPIARFAAALTKRIAITTVLHPVHMYGLFSLRDIGRMF